jgi:hypothetical protein
LYYEPSIEPGCAIVGASGSGKSYLALSKIARLGLRVRYDRETGIRTGPRVIVSDYKRDKAFRFLLDGNNSFQRPEGMKTHYGAHKNAVSVINEYYEPEFCSRLADSGDESPLYLYIDELPSLLSSLSKAERAELDANVYQYLAMNRNLGLSCTLALQRMDSTWFSPGARENVCSRVGLSFLSRDSARMLFPDADEIEPQGTGRGYYLAGSKLSRIIVPHVSDIERLRHCIWKAVTW